MATYYLQKQGKHFEVEANSQEEAIAKVQAYFGQEEPAAQQEAAPPDEPRGIMSDVAPPSDLPGVTDTGEITDAQGNVKAPDQLERSEGVSPATHLADGLKELGVGAWHQYLRTKNAAEYAVLNPFETTSTALDLGGTMATAAMTEPVAGIAGLVTLVGSQNADLAAEVVRSVQDWGTWDPKTSGGKSTLFDLARPLMAMDHKVDQFSMAVAGQQNGGEFDPLVAAAVKTAVYGTLEAAGFWKGMKVAGTAERAAAVREVEHAIRTEAARLGVVLKQGDMQDSIIGAARRMSPMERGQNAGQFGEMLQAAKVQMKAELDEAYAVARKSAAFAPVDRIKAIAPEAIRKLIGEHAYRLDDFPIVSRALKELDEIGTHKPGFGPRFKDPKKSVEAVQLTDLDNIRKSLNNTTPGTPEWGAAQTLKKLIDDEMTNMLAKDLLSGDPEGMAKWARARGMNVKYKDLFENDRLIMKMLDQDATAAQIHNALLGASALGANKGGANLLRKIERIFGKDSNVYKGIRQDFIYELVEPLLGDRPNWKGFINRYDLSRARHGELHRALQMDNMTDMKLLRQFAHTADRLPPGKIEFQDATTIISRLLFGHQIARKGLQVRLARDIMNMFLGKDRVTQREIIADLSGQIMDKPIREIDPSGYRLYAASTAAEGLLNTYEDMTRQR